MKGGFKVGFCVSGNGRLFRAAAIHADELGIQPVLVVAEAKSSPELEEFCRHHSIPFHRLSERSRPALDEEIFRVCAGAQLDLLALTFDKLIPASLVRHYQGRIINVHPALLPAFKGMHALEQVAGAGARFTGATIHEVDDEMDHGPIIAQCVLCVRRDESAASLGRRIFPLLRLMYMQVIAWYAEGRVVKDAQGRVWVRDAIYGELPLSPALERSFPD